MQFASWLLCCKTSYMLDADFDADLDFDVDADQPFRVKH